MSASLAQRTRWTTSDIELLPDNGTRYEIIDGRLQQVEVYRRKQAFLKLNMTLLASDMLASPLLPDFSISIAQFFV